MFAAKYLMLLNGYKGANIVFVNCVKPNKRSNALLNPNYALVMQHVRLHSVLKFEHEIITFDSMKINLKYVNNSKGQTIAVRLSLTEWEKILSKLKKFEEAFKIKSDLKEAFEQVDILKKSKGEKQTLKDFLNEL